MSRSGIRVFDRRSTAPLRRRLHAMRERAENVLPAWDAVADWFGDQNRLQWGSRGARWRTIWPELAEETVRQKRDEGWTGDILRRSRTLERSLTDRRFGIELLEPTSMRVGTRVPYAIYHQKGRGHNPRRVLFSATRIAQEGAVSHAVISWIVHGRPIIREAR